MLHNIFCVLLIRSFHFVVPSFFHHFSAFLFFFFIILYISESEYMCVLCAVCEMWMWMLEYMLCICVYIYIFLFGEYIPLSTYNRFSQPTNQQNKNNNNQQQQQQQRPHRGKKTYVKFGSYNTHWSTHKINIFYGVYRERKKKDMWCLPIPYTQFSIYIYR